MSRLSTFGKEIFIIERLVETKEEKFSKK